MRNHTLTGLMRTVAVAVLAGLAVVALADPGLAKAKARPKAPPKPAARLATYVGIWGENAVQCRKPIPVQGSNSPVRFTAKGYDQWEQHCNLAAIKAIGGTWTMNARCVSVGAPNFNDKAVIWATATRLTVKWQTERANLNYIRCR